MKIPVNFFLIIIFSFSLLLCSSSCDKAKATDATIEAEKSKSVQPIPIPKTEIPTIDTVDYNKRMLALSNKDTSGRWPAKKTPYPLSGAILPYNRIIAFSGSIQSVAQDGSHPAHDDARYQHCSHNKHIIQMT